MPWGPVSEDGRSQSGITWPVVTPLSGLPPSGPCSVTPTYVGNDVSPWLRLGAGLLDVVIAVVTLGIGWAIWDLVLWRIGQSPAKQILGMRIVDARTELPINWSRSFVRNFVLYGILGLIPFLGWIYCIVGAFFVFGSDRQALWDRIARTRVISSRQSS